MNANDSTAVVQNLKDAGCDDGTIAAFMKAINSGRLAEGLKLLSMHRRSLLEDLHEDQKQIDCLDYLIYQLNKTK